MHLNLGYLPFFQFRTTYKERAMESGKAFAQGVFPDDNVEIPPPLEEDKLLRVRFYL